MRQHWIAPQAWFRQTQEWPTAGKGAARGSPGLSPTLGRWPNRWVIGDGWWPDFRRRRRDLRLRLTCGIRSSGCQAGSA
jgi:hypothetical protein